MGTFIDKQGPGKYHQGNRQLRVTINPESFKLFLTCSNNPVNDCSKIPSEVVATPASKDPLYHVHFTRPISQGVDVVKSSVTLQVLPIYNP